MCDLSGLAPLQAQRGDTGFTQVAPHRALFWVQVSRSRVHNQSEAPDIQGQTGAGDPDAPSTSDVPRRPQPEYKGMRVLDLGES